MPGPDNATAWLVICRDAEESSALRKRYLERHLAYIETIVDLVAVAGPMADRADGDFKGSCFVYRTDDRAVAESLLCRDPYFEAGLYRDVEFRALFPKAGVWLGGTTWRRPGSHDSQ